MEKIPSNHFNSMSIPVAGMNDVLVTIGWKTIKSSPTILLKVWSLRAYHYIKRGKLYNEIVSSFNLSLMSIFRDGNWSWKKLCNETLRSLLPLRPLSWNWARDRRHELRRTFHCSRTDTILCVTSKNVGQGYIGEPRGTGETSTKFSSHCRRDVSGMQISAYK